MRVKLFTFRYSATLGGFDDEALQQFVRDKEVVAFREHFFVVNELPHLACVLTWQDAVVARASTTEASPSKRNGRPAGKAKPDPTAGLDESQRALFNDLREWRSAKAHEEGVPPYVVFTNRQLVEIVERRPENPTELACVEGVGSGKLERYGPDLLQRLAPAPVGSEA